jgi:TPR repeat protein
VLEGKMAVAVVRSMMGLAIASTLVSCTPAGAADVGGWFAEQQKARDQAASNPVPDACPQVITRAAADASAAGAYHAALCYLQGDSPDLVAAKAWLARASELKYLPAHRMLRALNMAEAASHSPGRHCHNLGEGRQICHGGAPALPVAEIGTK